MQNTTGGSYRPATTSAPSTTVPENRRGSCKCREVVSTTTTTTLSSTSSSAKAGSVSTPQPGALNNQGPAAVPFTSTSGFVVMIVVINLIWCTGLVAVVAFFGMRKRKEIIRSRRETMENDRLTKPQADEVVTFDDDALNPPSSSMASGDYALLELRPPPDTQASLANASSAATGGTSQNASEKRRHARTEPPPKTSTEYSQF